MLARCPICGAEQCWGALDKRPECDNCKRNRPVVTWLKHPPVIRHEIDTNPDESTGTMTEASPANEQPIYRRKKRFADKMIEGGK